MRRAGIDLTTTKEEKMKQNAFFFIRYLEFNLALAEFKRSQDPWVKFIPVCNGRNRYSCGRFFVDFYHDRPALYSDGCDIIDVYLFCLVIPMFVKYFSDCRFSRKFPKND